MLRLWKNFLDRQALVHEPFCNQVKVEDFSQKKEDDVVESTPASLQIDGTQLESNFSQILVKMLQKSNCTEEEK